MLLVLLFKRLEWADPQEYEEMGRPSLVLRNNLGGGFARMKFLFAREHRALGERYLPRASTAESVVFFVYLFLWPIGSIMSIFAPVAT